MLFRRVAAAVGLVAAALASQAPEYTQQYRQRLGGAIDELQAMIARFDSEAADQSLTREQGITRLKDNGDPLAQGRGAALDEAVVRADRLTRQRDAFRTAGPISQYAILMERFDPGLARRTVGDYQPAAPLTLAGLIAAMLGFAVGWLGTHVAAVPFRRRRLAGRPPHGAATTASSRLPP